VGAQASTTGQKGEPETMSRKHNTKHARTRSHYPERLKARGETGATVRMKSLAELNRGRKFTPPSDDGR
jgi:hypothetical protein